ncbi:MAG: O-antigen ligase family protein [Geminicoccaceae bacterium]|nr:O-antigen ligase family protein [Geminicoccaceae bacterium]
MALLLPLLLLAPNLAHALEGHDPAGLIWRLLTAYVLGTALLAVWFVPDFLLRGRPDLARVDFSGSLVAHAGLCVVYLLMTLANIECASRPLAAAAQLALAGAAAVSILLTGTRTALVTCGIYCALDVAAAKRPSERLARLAPALLGTLVLLTCYTLVISDDFLERLVPGNSEDWSSGRAVSQLHWLASALDEPFGLGFGFVRERLADGRPALDGTRLLEWPHNEPLRFFVEAGLPGLLFVVLLLGHLVRLAVRAARAESRPLPRATMLAIAADMLAQSLFQNYFNSVYYATGLLVVLVTLAASVEERRPHTASCRRSSAHDDLPGSAATA